MNCEKTPALYAVVLAITVPTLFAEARLFAQWQHLTQAFPNIPADASSASPSRVTFAGS
jgi:uncharacterized membrane protein